MYHIALSRKKAWLTALVAGLAAIIMAALTGGGVARAATSPDAASSESVRLVATITDRSQPNFRQLDTRAEPRLDVNTRKWEAVAVDGNKTYFYTEDFAATPSHFVYVKGRAAYFVRQHSVRWTSCQYDGTNVATATFWLYSVKYVGKQPRASKLLATRSVTGQTVLPYMFNSRPVNPRSGRPAK